MEEDDTSTSSSGGEEDRGSIDDTANASDVEAHAFDIRLPGTHPYLNSSQLGEIAGTSLYSDPGCELTVPALVMDAVLLPGQTLPLHFTDARCIEFMREASRQKHYIVLLTNKQPDPEDAQAYIGVSSHVTGTLFQIQNASETSGDGHSLTRRRKLTIQAVGKQRCRLVNSLRSSDVLCEEYSLAVCDKVKIEVVGEEELGPYIRALDGSTINRLPARKRHRWLAALYHTSPHAIEQCCTESVVEWLKRWLQHWFDRSRIDAVIGQGQTLFSYWVASNLPVNLETKLELLSENYTDRRLNREWRIACRVLSK